MPSSVNEYVAMTASVLLNDSATRPPFTRAVVEAKQAAYVAWLAKAVR